MDSVVDSLNRRLARRRAHDPMPVNQELVNTLFELLQLADMRMGECVRSGPHTHTAVIRTRGEIRHLTSALVGVRL